MCEIIPIMIKKMCSRKTHDVGENEFFTSVLSTCTNLAKILRESNLTKLTIMRQLQPLHIELVPYVMCPHFYAYFFLWWSGRDHPVFNNTTYLLLQILWLYNDWILIICVPAAHSMDCQVKSSSRWASRPTPGLFGSLLWTVFFRSTPFFSSFFPSQTQ